MNYRYVELKIRNQEILQYMNTFSFFAKKYIKTKQKQQQQNDKKQKQN